MRDPRLKDRAWRERVGFDNIMTDNEVRFAEILEGRAI